LFASYLLLMKYVITHHSMLHHPCYRPGPVIMPVLYGNYSLSITIAMYTKIHEPRQFLLLLNLTSTRYQVFITRIDFSYVTKVVRRTFHAWVTAGKRFKLIAERTSGAPEPARHRSE
jgi:hypothetical protein